MKISIPSKIKGLLEKGPAYVDDEALRGGLGGGGRSPRDSKGSIVRQHTTFPPHRRLKKSSLTSRGRHLRMLVRVWAIDKVLHIFPQPPLPTRGGSHNRNPPIRLYLRQKEHKPAAGVDQVVVARVD